MTITVAIPYFDCPDLVGRAVASVLAQTHADLRVVVVGDGERPPVDGTDPRVVIYALPENRGNYFVRQLILLATPDEWYAPVDADDWVDPEHLERLLATGADAAVPGTLWFHEVRRRGVDPVWQGRRLGWHVGVFATERLRAIGGYEPDTRLSQDTHMLRILELAGPVRRLRGNPTYHRWKRPGSLTTAAATNLRSEPRLAARARNQRTLARCQMAASAEEIRAYRASIVDPAIAAELARHVEVLGALLRSRKAVAA